MAALETAKKALVAALELSCRGADEVLYRTIRQRGDPGPRLGRGRSRNDGSR